jgi:predicted unusual protein kinase regulating ubiquinone biosynthesis (AarF/ABC1/UbiB family)
MVDRELSEPDKDGVAESSSGPHNDSPGNGKQNGNSGAHLHDDRLAALNISFNHLYDPQLADKSVSLASFIYDDRFRRTARALVGFSMEAAHDFWRSKASPSELKKKKAQRMRQTLVELGPTFIKLGQFLSVRRDCLPPEIADELRLLQDRVPPFSFDLVCKTIESELGAAPDSIFKQVEKTPIASASIGQVHRAQLKDGRMVVIKVQRPDLAQRFYQDLGYMRLLARLGLLIRPEGQWEDWVGLSDEFGRTLFHELNYIQEGRNADKIRTALKDLSDVRVPRVYWKYTGRRVLTLEYVPGTKVDNVAELEARGLDRDRLGNLLVSCYLEQVLMHGFFHADPHAGNLSVDESGRLVLYDFGMVSEITEKQRDAITGCIASVIHKDAAELLHHLKELGIVKRDAQDAPLVRTLEPFIDYYAGKEVRHLDFTHLEKDIDQIALDRALTLPPSLAYVLRAGTSLEGIARTLKPNFSFVEAAKPALKKWILNRPGQAASLIKAFFNGNLSLSEEVILKLSPGKSRDELKKDKPKNVSKSKEGAKQLTVVTAQSEEISELKVKVDLLESQQKALLLAQAEGYRNVTFIAFWLLLSAIPTFVPISRPLDHYFLVGNGVMGAIIMWHLVRHSRLARSSKKNGTARGQRR